MQGVVLAAGAGTRLRPHTAEKPKGLVEVAGKPLLTHCFESLLGVGVTELIVVVGYRGAAIAEHYGDAHEEVPITYAEQADQRGTADAVLAAGPFVDGDVLVINGDNVYDADLDGVVETHERTGADATLLVDDVTPERATRGGVFELDAAGRIVGLVEKPERAPSTKIPRGFYAFSSRIFEACRTIEPSETGEYELTDAIDWLLRTDGVVETVAFEGACWNVNTVADIEAVEASLRDSR